jgi:hypothetical protein
MKPRACWSNEFDAEFSCAARLNQIRQSAIHEEPGWHFAVTCPANNRVNGKIHSILRAASAPPAPGTCAAFKNYRK